MQILRAENLSLGYDNVCVVKNLNFNVDEGDFVFVVGENGSGKSTLIKALLGLIKPMEGKIYYGIDRKDVGYLPQIDEIQADFPASVFEIVLSGALNSMGLRPFYSKKEKQKALEKLREVNIEDLKNKAFSELSGGQRQRVLIARALIATNKLIILDEPVSGLDPSSQKAMYESIKKINEDGISIMMVSHDIERLDYANRILSLGKENFFMSKEEYYKEIKRI